MKRLAALLLAAGAALADPTVVELACPPRAAYRATRDLDGDGIDDLLVVAPGEAWLWKGRAGAMRREPDTRIELPAGTALFDLCPAGEGLELVARNREAYWALAPGAAPRRLAHPSGPGLPRRPANVLWRGFQTDLDRDGAPEWVDVSIDGYAIHYGDGARVLLPPRLVETAETRVTAASDRLVARYAVGDWMDGDFDGDGRTDIALLVPGGLRVHTADEKGRITADRTLDIAFGLEEDAELTFLDFDGDGKMDVLAVRRKAGRAMVLLADPEKGLAQPRRTMLRVPGEIRQPVAADLDGDGRPDLALPYTSAPSIRMAMRAMVQGEVMLDVPLFLNGEKGIGERASKQLAFPVELRVGMDSAGRVQLGGLVIVEYEGDLDGDGRRDLLVTASATELALHPGRAGDVFAEEPSRRITIPDCAAFTAVYSGAANLNGDARSDIILWYDGAGRRPDRLFLLMSGK